MLSTRSWPTNRRRPAPRARRIANSDWRAAARASSRFAMFAQAIVEHDEDDRRQDEERIGKRLA